MAHLNKDSDAQRNIKTIAENLMQNELVKEKMQKFLEHFKFNSFSDALNITTQVFSEHHHNGGPVRSVPQRRRQKRMQTECIFIPVQVGNEIGDPYYQGWAEI
uniref:Uncharacterized protein n=1 Tax=Globodera pallida TaxID=36090 RepID=A0A183CB09_GLOPA